MTNNYPIWGSTISSNTAFTKCYTLNTSISSSSTTNALTINPGWSDVWPEDHWDGLLIDNKRVVIPKRELAYELPDGSVLRVDPKGNFTMDDAQARRVYEATRNYAFNPYVNASDLLAEFIRDCGKLRVRSGEIATLPLGLFVNWLVIRAAEADRDPIPADIRPVPKLIAPIVAPHCLGCGRFIRRRPFAYCAPGKCVTQHYHRLAA